MQADFPSIPGYQIDSEIAKGGMGVVYRARHLLLDRTVALKVIHPKFAADQEFVRSFAQEARIVARLTHPNIVSVYDFGSHEGLYYLSMQYVQGRPLSDLLSARRPSFKECADIVRQVADALDYAHKNEVLHRDVKTGNILLCPDGKAMVIDFGVAHGAYSTAANSIWMGAGTRGYMSPEQCRGFPASPRSDQYALAVAVYEMLAGRRPFTASDPAAVMQQHLTEIPPPLRRGRTDITPRTESAVLRALSKVPEMRFPSVGEFARELDAACREADDARIELNVSSGPSPDAYRRAANPTPSYPPASVAAIRGTGSGGNRSAAWWLIVVMVLAALAGTGYFLYQGSLTAAAKKPDDTKQKASVGAGRSNRSQRARRSARRSSAITTSPPRETATTPVSAGSAAPSPITAAPTDTDQQYPRNEQDSQPEHDRPDADKPAGEPESPA